MEKFGLNEYTYNLLIDYFKSNSEIKFVKIIGSRAKGKFRRASDIDLMVDGTFESDNFEKYIKEIKSLRIPYRIDLINTKKANNMKFIYTNYCNGKYFYKAKDFYKNETYEEIFKTEIFDTRQRWKQRYESRICGSYDLFWDKYKIYKQEYKNDIILEKDLILYFKKAYEALWIVTKDYLKEQGILLYFPRDVMKKAYEIGIIDNYKIWNDIIYYLNIITDEPFIEVREELIYRLSSYVKAFQNLQHYFGEKYANENN